MLESDLPTMSAVKSSNIKAVGYDDDSAVMYVRFHNDAVYKYENVPPHTVMQMMGAKSLGSYFYAQIRKSYQCEQVMFDEGNGDGEAET